MSSQERNQSEQSKVNQEENINTKDFLIGALIGGMVGAAAALFLAPKSGKELRSNINEQAIVLKEKTGQLKDTAMTKGTQLAEAAKEKSNVLAQTVSKQSIELVNKVKSINPLERQNEGSKETNTAQKAVNNDEIQKKLEDTKRAFDETEYKYNY
ncbi:YtxH domain-containing protein [Cytobacillus depressus]|uniref:YtxH domain-containing protein n=1 Tax=Cytobacillus depressus TaxID=1602942 RepID=A0A6L3VB18_9BACI|nr:YtxH domain-containing protein [Cytobacillus depressus]KAB2338866.1 YtxH domain-containing protein [Cytobacillus depressus]